MRRSRYRSVLGSLGACSVVVGLAACSLVTSLSGLTGGAPDAGPESASTGGSGGGASSSGGSSSGGSSGSGSSGGSSGSSSGAGEAGAGDAGEDGGALDDAASPRDGGADADTSHDSGTKDAASDAGHDAGPSPFCATQSPAPLFCDDFDDGGTLATPWDQLASTSGSEQLSAASYVSPPYAMLVNVNPNASPSAIDVAGYKSFPAKQGVAGTATDTFDIRIDAADESGSSDAILSAIQLWNGSAYWDLELEVFYASATGDFTVSMSEDGTSYVEHAASQHLPMATWTRVTLAITLPAGAGGATTATLAFNGVTVASATVHVSTSNPIPEILLGTTYATPTAGGWAVAYDNVTFDER